MIQCLLWLCRWENGAHDWSKRLLQSLGLQGWWTMPNGLSKPFQRTECVTYSLHHLFLSNAFVCTHVNATCTKNVGVKINWTLWSWIMVMNFIQSSLRMIYMTYATTGFWLFLVTEHAVNPCELWLYIWCLLWDGIIGIKILCINFFNNNNNFFKDIVWENPLAKGISWKSFLFHDKTKINI